MAELKPGWQRVRFGDVVRQVKDKADPTESGLDRYIAGEHMDTDDLRLRRWGQISDDYLGPAFHMRFKPGQVLYGSRRTYLRKVAVADFDGICANTTFVLESQDPGVLLPELLPFVMSTDTFHNHSIKQSKGSVNPYVNFSDLAWYEFALPSLREQRRIAGLLRCSASVIDAHLDGVLTATQLLSAAAIDALGLRRYDPHKGIGHDWPTKPGKAIFVAGSGSGTPILSASGTAMFLKVADFNRNTNDRALGVSECVFNPIENPTVKIFPPGTVVFPKRGATIFHGKAGILNRPAALDPNLMALTAKCDELEPEFLCWLVVGIGLWRIADTTSVPQLNHKHLNALKFPIPQLKVQRAICRQLASVSDSRADGVVRAARAADLHRQLVNSELGEEAGIES